MEDLVVDTFSEINIELKLEGDNNGTTITKTSRSDDKLHCTQPDNDDGDSSIDISSDDAVPAESEPETKENDGDDKYQEIEF